MGAVFFGAACFVFALGWAIYCIYRLIYIFCQVKKLEGIERRITMCKHKMIKMGDVVACTKCGLTILPDKKIVFDRKLPGRKEVRNK